MTHDAAWAFAQHIWRTQYSKLLSSTIESARRYSQKQAFSVNGTAVTLDPLRGADDMGLMWVRDTAFTQ
jgi:hypothetical protein